MRSAIKRLSMRRREAGRGGDRRGSLGDRDERRRQHLQVRTGQATQQLIHHPGHDRVAASHQVLTGKRDPVQNRPAAPGAALQQPALLEPRHDSPCRLVRLPREQGQGMGRQSGSDPTASRMPHWGNVMPTSASSASQASCLRSCARRSSSAISIPVGTPFGMLMTASVRESQGPYIRTHTWLRGGRPLSRTQGVRDATPGLIDVHAHFTTDAYVAAAKAAGHLQPDGMPGHYWPRWNADEHIGLMEPPASRRRSSRSPHPESTSVTIRPPRNSPGRSTMPRAAIVDAHPDRFGFFASLPVPEVQAALRELRYALDELGRPASS